jgi:hypothetical protein
MRRTLFALTLAFAVAAPAAPAQAEVPAVTGGGPQAVTGSDAQARGSGVQAAAASPLLWATVNRCDTPSSPNQMGVRASMPGNGLRQRMYMRFRAQYWDGAAEAWRPVSGVGVSPWRYAGSARYRSSQAGWTFEFDQPASGRTYTLRGVVEYQWRGMKRKRSKRARRAHRLWHRRARRWHRRAHRHHHGSRARHRRVHRRYRRAHRRLHRRLNRRVVRAWKAVANRRRATQSGVAGVRGGDPVGTSKAACLIW